MVRTISFITALVLLASPALAQEPAVVTPTPPPAPTLSGFEQLLLEAVKTGKGEFHLTWDKNPPLPVAVAAPAANPAAPAPAPAVRPMALTAPAGRYVPRAKINIRLSPGTYFRVR